MVSQDPDVGVVAGDLLDSVDHSVDFVFEGLVLEVGDDGEFRVLRPGVEGLPVEVLGDLEALVPGDVAVERVEYLLSLREV